MQESLIQKTAATRDDLWMTVPLRLMLGVIFLAHGSQKLFGWFGGRGLKGTATHYSRDLHMTPGTLWAVLNTFGEFAGALSVLLGLLTRFGALNIAIVMAVAIQRVHRGKFFQPGGMEFPLALLGAALALMIAGGGAFSLDEVISKRRAEEKEEEVEELKPVRDVPLGVNV